VSQVLDRVRQVAKVKKSQRFTSLLHHVNPEWLRAAYFVLKRNAAPAYFVLKRNTAPGADGVTWKEYGKEDLDSKWDS